LGALDEKLASPAGKEILVFEIRSAILHPHPAPPFPASFSIPNILEECGKAAPPALCLLGGKRICCLMAGQLQQAQGGV
jgi:hypothetical protein